MTLGALLSNAPRAANKFLDARAIRGDISETSIPVPPTGFFPSCARRCSGRALTASAIHCNSLTADTAERSSRLLCLKPLGKSDQGQEYPETDPQS